MVLRLPETRKPVAKFTCAKWPKLRIRNVEFNDGECTVYSEKDANLVRIAHGFGTNIIEVPLHAPTEPVPGPVAHQGMQTTAPPVQTLPPAPKPEPTPEPEAPSTDEVFHKGGGWWTYQGKNYRKADLPPEALELLGE